MKFTVEVNLDDEQELNEYISTHKTTNGRRLANALGFKGKGSSIFADNLSAYAWNAKTARACRLSGNMKAALLYEGICDKIYANDLEPRMEGGW